MTARAALVVLFANAWVSVALIATYAQWIAPPHAPRLAVLDVAELYRLKEREVAAVLVKGATTEEDRRSALQRASTFGAELSALIERLPAECQCLILVRGAIVGPTESLPDMTPLIRQRLGL